MLICSEWANIDLVWQPCRIMDEKFPEKSPHERLIFVVSSTWLANDYLAAVDDQGLSGDVP